MPFPPLRCPLWPLIPPSPLCRPPCLLSLPRLLPLLTPLCFPLLRRPLWLLILSSLLRRLPYLLSPSRLLPLLLSPSRLLPPL